MSNNLLQTTFIINFPRKKEKLETNKKINGINEKLMELMKINGNWWKILMELVENFCKYWKSPNIEATMAKNP